jgi:tRNA threonylcarbamoyladenosine biosynthesis protein TsaE
MYFTLQSGSYQRTGDVGAVLADVMARGDVLCLSGELGAGKTVLVQGIARALGYEGPVPSPTFTIINPYPEIGLCHVDAFRLEGADELIGAGIEEYLDGEWICAVEWAERVRPALPDGALEVSISFGQGDDDRVLTFGAAGDFGGRAELMRARLEGA